MPFSLTKHKRLFLIFSAVILTLFLGIGIGFLTNHVFSENARFEAFTEKIFRQEVTGNSLTLHYTLAYPEKQKIQRPSPTLGTVDFNIEKSMQLCKEYEDTLKKFSYSRLSPENQITLDMLLLYFHTQRSLNDHVLLEEYLSPGLGIQAQLPVLLAEYVFYEDQDITDYLNLLTSVEPYFQSILEFEQKKSEAGTFMSDATLDRILQQCTAFIENPESNYMLEIFAQKIADYGHFSEKEQEALNSAHKEILLNHVIPAYQNLIAGLSSLRGTGNNPGGLAHFEGGRDYYEYLLKSQAGAYLPVKKIEKRLSQQLLHDSRELQKLVQNNPSVIQKLTSDSFFQELSPTSVLEFLQKKMTADFPALEKVSYEVRYVHRSMEDYLSPAFYLTPPLDTGNPNIIYINRSDQRSGLDLFTTLAHEGFPGHLYQTVFFGRQNPCNIRYLFNSAGYAEGWATYVESYASRYAIPLLNDSSAEDIARINFLNRSINLCIYSLLDIGIHYHGWSKVQAAQFLSTFGIHEDKIKEEIFQYIVETPANYLKYYWGYLNFLDLKTAQKKKLGKSFDLKEFHRRILEIGPVPFPVLEKYIVSGNDNS